MAAKRLREDPDNNILDKPEGKKLRSWPSFTMVIRQAVAANTIQNLCLALEPVLRSVVREEVERVLRRARSFQRSPQMLIEEAKPSSSLELIFKKHPSHPMFTDTKIEDEDGFPLEILLIDRTTKNKPEITFPSSIKVELVVLDGEFPCDDSSNWSTTDFNRHIVKERIGKRPLLIGDIVVTLKDGSAFIDELKFTDNSSWIRSRNFQIGVRALSEDQQGFNIREAVTGRFMVKDHRGEGYKKHYPPALGDDVWRLKKIGKDGVLHKKLAAENINNVQEFLKLSIIDPDRLRNILGMSERNWEATINHARTCPLGEKRYIHHGPHFAIILNPICEVVKIDVDGVLWTFQELMTPMKTAVQELVLEAYNCWERLTEISLPLQGEPMNEVLIESPFHIESFFE